MTKRPLVTHSPTSQLFRGRVGVPQSKELEEKEAPLVPKETRSTGEQEEVEVSDESAMGDNVEAEDNPEG